MLNYCIWIQCISVGKITLVPVIKNIITIIIIIIILIDQWEKMKELRT